MPWWIQHIMQTHWCSHFLIWTPNLSLFSKYITINEIACIDVSAGLSGICGACDQIFDCSWDHAWWVLLLEPLHGVIIGFVLMGSVAFVDSLMPKGHELNGQVFFDCCGTWAVCWPLYWRTAQRESIVSSSGGDC